ncbi:hypothetical protein YQE_09984, partial [Dendroctonus ponderosae]
MGRLMWLGAAPRTPSRSTRFCAIFLANGRLPPAAAYHPAPFLRANQKTAKLSMWAGLSTMGPLPSVRCNPATGWFTSLMAVRNCLSPTTRFCAR